MSVVYTREQVIERLNKTIDTGKPIYLANTGCGLTARLEELGGADIISLAPTSYWRFKGMASFAGPNPFSDCYEVIMQVAREAAPMIKHTPLISLSCTRNPLRPQREHLEALREVGVCGITPLMTNGKGDYFEHKFSSVGVGYNKEIECIETARLMGMFTMVYAYTVEEAIALTAAGADAISAHLGGTVGGLVGSKTDMTIAQAAERSQKIFDAARQENKDAILFCHGGPVVSMDDVKYMMRETSAQGFIGGSAAERIPIEEAIIQTTQMFKAY